MKLIFSDQKIIDSLRSTDDSEINTAFRHLYQSYYRMALKIVKVNRGFESDAEDVFQDVLIVLYQNIRKGIFRGDSSIKTYLYAMIRNQWLARHKKNARILNVEIPEVAMAVRHSNFKKENSVDELEAMVCTLLEQVSERCREILKLYYFDNFSMSEIAKRANFENENSAKVQKYKCMKRLVQVISGKPDLKKALYELLAERD